MRSLLYEMLRVCLLVSDFSSQQVGHWLIPGVYRASLGSVFLALSQGMDFV